MPSYEMLPLIFMGVEMGIIPIPAYQPERQSRADSRDDMEKVMY
jgi:hypothetical protein